MYATSLLVIVEAISLMRSLRVGSSASFAMRSKMRGSSGTRSVSRRSWFIGDTTENKKGTGLSVSPSLNR